MTPDEFTGYLQQDPDPVNHPAHYQGAGGLEAIDVIEAFLGVEGAYNYCRANILKYALRAGAKGDAAQDLRKAAWYAERAAGLREANLNE